MKPRYMLLTALAALALAGCQGDSDGPGNAEAKPLSTLIGAMLEDTSDTADAWPMNGRNLRFDEDPEPYQALLEPSGN